MEQNLNNNFIDKFNDKGYYILKNILHESHVESLRMIIDDIMLGKRYVAGRHFQLDDSNQGYTNLTKPEPKFMGPSFNYRKVKDLEQDPDLLDFFQAPYFHQIATTLIGPNVSIMRAMLLNKPTNGKSTFLPFHQDVSDEWPMTAPPSITFWIPLDDVNADNGCLEVYERSHLLGKIESGHFISPQKLNEIERACPPTKLSMKAGDILFFDCKLVHGSGINFSSRRRRAITLCLMAAEIKNTKTNKQYPKLFGEKALTRLDVEKLQDLTI